MVRAGVAEHPDRGRVELSLLRLFAPWPSDAKTSSLRREIVPSRCLAFRGFYPVSDDVLAYNDRHARLTPALGFPCPSPRWRFARTFTPPRLGERVPPPQGARAAVEWCRSRSPPRSIRAPRCPASTPRPARTSTWPTSSSRPALERRHGRPHDYGRPFVKGALDGSAACGSWACSPGAGTRPTRAPSTEWFYVLSGRGCGRTRTGAPHTLRPGRRGGAPRGWYGRWDITEHIHKIWLTHTHEDKQGASKRPTTAPLACLVESLATNLSSAGRSGVAAYDADGFRAGSGLCPRVARRSSRTTQTPSRCSPWSKASCSWWTPTAAARRCVPGDVVFLPRDGADALRGGDAARRSRRRLGRGDPRDPVDLDRLERDDRLVTGLVAR